MKPPFDPRVALRNDLDGQHWEEEPLESKQTVHLCI